MLREVARRIDQLLGKLHHLVEPRIVRIEAGPARLLLLHAGLRPAPQHAGERADGVVGQPERLADLADRAAAAIADDRRGEVGVVAAVFLVDVLDHLLAPLVLEIDVDVGRLLALLGDEALEQEVDLLGIDLGDLEAIADDRIGRGAAPLAQNALGAREADDIVHGEEIGRVVQLGRHLELACRAPRAPSAGAVRIAPPLALLGERHQRLLRASRSRRGSRPDIRCFSSSSSEKLQRSRKRSVRSIASGARRNSRAISVRALRCRSALASSSRPAVSMVTCSRMQVMTSCSGRRSGA